MKKLFTLQVLVLITLVLSACDSEPPSEPTVESASESSNSELIVLNDDISTAIASIVELYLSEIDANYSDVALALDTLHQDIVSFLASPTTDSLAAVRNSWNAAYAGYELTAIHRFYADAILDENLSLALFQLQYQINHWPILPGYLDYVVGYPASGIVNDMTVEITPENLRAQHGAFDADEAAIGFHVLEFLLWGENADQSSPRSFQDFVPQTEPNAQQRMDNIAVSELSNNRRRRLLETVSVTLTEDFESLMSDWAAAVLEYRLQLSDVPAEKKLLGLLDGLTAFFTEELLVRSLYPMLNGEFLGSLPSPYSASSQIAVSSQLATIDRLLLEIRPDNGIGLDSALSDISDEYNEYFFENFDASKECLVVLYSGELYNENSNTAETEFKVVECINFLTNMIDYLQQIKLNIAA